jgi:hypothetical protein
MRSLQDWLRSFFEPDAPLKGSVSLEGGIAKDPNYVPKAPFFVNGRAKFDSILPTVPTRLEKHIKLPPSHFYSKDFKHLDLENMDIPHLDTKDGKISPSYVFDQYLQSVEGGTQALVQKTQENYLRDQDKIPWKQDIQNRDFAVEVTTVQGIPKPSSYEPELREVHISPYELEMNANNRKYNGFPEKGNVLTFSESLIHELAHAATFDHTDFSKGGSQHHKELQSVGNDIHDINHGEEENPDGLKRPYQYASGEEYKVGTLIFLNKSRQLTGKMLVDPQEIHQLFDEIESDPSILDQNYYHEEARLPRTYLLLKKTNPQGAELLRNAVARDSQYLAKSGIQRSQVTLAVAKSKGPEQVDPNLVGHLTVAQGLSHADPNSPNPLPKGLIKITQRLKDPIENWVGDLKKDLSKNLNALPQMG